ncbi:hypothetical protein Cgig2_012477 [Carnegiea gigantea]|uniref:Endonuclease/exonuclease/phosphatase domain-containing protein n=1 Tax=Carnegiea gigantea TaxID=171969 RepID=A0A9Q1QKY8_9CARY|nr:hypothetical protein Cgig2_012477 [Carnegiea gigantea]
MGGGDPQWHFTGIYGCPETQNKLLTCELLRELKGQCPLSWLVGGDLNEIVYNYEKTEGPPKPLGILDAFQQTFTDCGFLDLGFSRHEFRRWNGRDEEASIEERTKIGHVQNEIRRRKERIALLANAQERKGLLDKLSEWRRKEEILWWQHSGVDFLCFGDKNSGWLHNRPTVRKATNTISGLKGTDILIHSNVQEMEDIVVGFFDPPGAQKILM